MILTMVLFFFFNDTATTEIYTLSLHDALPISPTPRSIEDDRPRTGLLSRGVLPMAVTLRTARPADRDAVVEDRKSTRLNSSHANISYAVFCLKKKTKESTDAYITLRE